MIRYKEHFEKRDLTHDDSFVLEFSAFDQLFKLSLEPNTELFHPEATVTVFNDSITQTVERLVPHDYLIYKGHVHHPHEWARIVFKDNQE